MIMNPEFYTCSASDTSLIQIHLRVEFVRHSSNPDYP